MSQQEMFPLPEPTLKDKLLCAERELDLRRRIYPRLVENRKMTKQMADYEIHVMRAIVADYRARSEQESAS